MSTNQVFPVILSGGTGSRLWPLSRSEYPKQFLKLTGEHTMLQATSLRINNNHIYGLHHPIVICNESHRFIVAEQLQQIGMAPSAIVLEPAAKNTAPAIALGAIHAMKMDSNAVIVVLPADHMVKNTHAFQAAVEHAINVAANQNKIVTFGIVPSRSDTGFGYIQATSKTELSDIQQFVEKPDHSTAQQYLEDGRYFWNSGIFVMKASVYLQELQQFEPDMLAQVSQSYANAVTDLDFIRIDKDTFNQAPENSIDYAVMEKTTKGVVLPIDVGWDDIGSFSALWQVLDKDSAGNVCMGDVKNIDSSNCLIQSENQFVATIGVNDLVIVGTKDSVLVADKNRMQDVKQIVSYLKSTNRSEHLIHREVHRPWGKYDCIDNGNRYQVKRVTVKPGASLSKQLHHHRSEHWIVVAGTALVEINDQESLLSENQSVYIPVGTPHRLSNPGKVMLELIEVQSGSYLGEDDIVRFDDIYGR